MSKFKVGDKVRQNEYGMYPWHVGHQRVGIVERTEEIFAHVFFDGVESGSPQNLWAFLDRELDLVND